MPVRASTILIARKPKKGTDTPVLVFKDKISLAGYSVKNGQSLWVSGELLDRKLFADTRHSDSPICQRFAHSKMGGYLLAI